MTVTTLNIDKGMMIDVFVLPVTKQYTSLNSSNRAITASGVSTAPNKIVERETLALRVCCS